MCGSTGWLPPPPWLKGKGREISIAGRDCKVQCRILFFLALTLLDPPPPLFMCNLYYFILPNIIIILPNGGLQNVSYEITSCLHFYQIYHTRISKYSYIF